MVRLLVAPSLAVAVALAPAPAMAHAPATGDASSPADDPDLAQAQALYEEGKAKFETADYDGAIELWTEAYTGVPQTPAYARIRVLLLYNLATARERAFEVVHDLRHLRQAQILLSNFERSLDALYDRNDPAQAAEADKERRRVRKRLAQIQARIERVEAEARADRGHAGGRRGAEDRPRPVRPLLVSGGVLLGLGAAGLGIMGGGMALGARANDLSGLDPTDIESRRNQFERGRAGNAMAIAGAVAGGALLVTGAALLAVGLRRRHAAREGRAAARLVPGPGGIALVGRF